MSGRGWITALQLQPGQFAGQGLQAPELANDGLLPVGDDRRLPPARLHHRQHGGQGIAQLVSQPGKQRRSFGLPVPPQLDQNPDVGAQGLRVQRHPHVHQHHGELSPRRDPHRLLARRRPDDLEPQRCQGGVEGQQICRHIVDDQDGRLHILRPTMTLAPWTAPESCTKSSDRGPTLRDLLYWIRQRRRRTHGAGMASERTGEHPGALPGSPPLGLVRQIEAGRALVQESRRLMASVRVRVEATQALLRSYGYQARRPGA